MHHHPETHRIARLAMTGLLAAGLAVARPSAAQSPDDGDASGAILVLAASSLTDVLPAIASTFESITGTPVRFSFDATSRLAAQAEAGAPADVFVSADRAWIGWLERRGLLAPGSEVEVARNELVFVVPRGRRSPTTPSEVAGLERVAVGGENVPAGRYARQAFSASGVWDVVQPKLVTAGSVRGVLEWVARGEVDGGVVYRTDALAEPDVTVAFSFAPLEIEPVSYRAAVMSRSARLDAARAFVAHLTGSDAVGLLRDAGFTVGAPAEPPQGSAEGPAPGRETTSAPAPPLPSVASAIGLSLLVALLATLLGLVPAVALGWLLARHDFPGKALVSMVVLAPLVLPPVVTGFLLLSLLGRQGLLGSTLSALGLSVPFTLAGATLAALVVGLPLYVLSVRGAFEAVDPLYEELSWTLGEGPRRTFFRVALPLAIPGIAAGAVLAFARALGEFGATVVLAGNVEGSTRTIALAVYTLLEAPGGRDATWILVGASVGLSLLALLGFEALSRRQRRRVRDEHGR